jgi:hypothetical protein
MAGKVAATTREVSLLYKQSNLPGKKKGLNKVGFIKCFVLIIFNLQENSEKKLFPNNHAS